MRISTKRWKIPKYQTNHRAEDKIIELKISIEGFDSRLNEAKERISELKDRAVEFIKSEEQKEKKEWKREVSLRDLWDTTRKTDIHITLVPEREKGRDRKLFWRNNGWKFP